jgi:hypothetical protein
MGTPSVERRPGLAVTIWLYTSARLAVVAIVAGLLLLAGVPLLISVLVGLIVALPLSMVLFRPLRDRLDGALAVTRERRAAERSALRSGLRGDAPAEPAAAHDAGTPDPEIPGAGADAAGVDTAGAGISEERPADQQAQPQPDRGER